MPYTPRRQSSRWLDGDCPPHVLAIYDHPAFADRFTVFYRDAPGVRHYERDPRGAGPTSS